MARKRKGKKTQPTKMLQQIEPDAAGIDVRATAIYIAIPDDNRAPETVLCYDTFT